MFRDDWKFMQSSQKCIIHCYGSLRLTRFNPLRDCGKRNLEKWFGNSHNRFMNFLKNFFSHNPHENLLRKVFLYFFLLQIHVTRHIWSLCEGVFLWFYLARKLFFSPSDHCRNSFIFSPPMVKTFTSIWTHI